MPYFDRVAQLGRFRIGLSHDLVLDGGEPYLERWILWCGFTLRLHKFIKGDDDRAFHDHPWWFITLPLRSYRERLPNRPPRIVHRWRPHFRKADHRHIVQLIGAQPVWTFIVTGPKRRDWGFWEGGDFTHHEAWLAQRESRPPGQPTAA